MREPWFRIVDVFEGDRRSMADIVVEVAGLHSVQLKEMRGARQNRQVAKARKDAIVRLKFERPDLSSGTIANFLRCDPSHVRHIWRSAA
jgi:chromosomal replication initiation ATPase DnaA